MSERMVLVNSGRFSSWTHWPRKDFETVVDEMGERQEERPPRDTHGAQVIEVEVIRRSTIRSVVVTEDNQ